MLACYKTRSQALLYQQKHYCHYHHRILLPVNPTCNACKCEMQSVFSCRSLFTGFQLCRTGNGLDLWTLCLMINIWIRDSIERGLGWRVSGCKVTLVQ